MQTTSQYGIEPAAQPLPLLWPRPGCPHVHRLILSYNASNVCMVDEYMSRPGVMRQAGQSVRPAWCRRTSPSGTEPDHRANHIVRNCSAPALLIRAVPRAGGARGQPDRLRHRPLWPIGLTWPGLMARSFRSLRSLKKTTVLWNEAQSIVSPSMWLLPSESRGVMDSALYRRLPWQSGSCRTQSSEATKALKEVVCNG